MTDRELLEKAAKAAGVEIWFYGHDVRLLRNKTAAEIWNPLTDDGDALRLAVKLKMEVSIWASDTTVETDTSDRVQESHKSDPYASTRRAIVRAAAAIGEAMP